MDANFLPLILILFVGLVVWINVLLYKRARQLVYGWAAQGGLQILEMEQRWFRRGPFFWRTSKGQVVFYVTVRDKAEKRYAYVKCGGFWLGMFSERIEVSWDGI